MATYRELMQALLEMAEAGDVRLDDNVTIRTPDGEYYPAELLEFNGDDVLDNGCLFIVAHDWHERFEKDEDL